MTTLARLHDIQKFFRMEEYDKEACAEFMLLVSPDQLLFMPLMSAMFKSHERQEWEWHKVRAVIPVVTVDQNNDSKAWLSMTPEPEETEE